MKTKRRVFKITELSNLIKKPYNIAKVYSNRLIEKKLANKIMKGVLSFSDNELITATQIVEPSYISFDYSFYYYKLIQQVPSQLELVTTKKTRKISDLKYRQISTKLFFGYNRELIDNSYVFIAEPEKAILDSIYYNQVDFSYFNDLLGSCDIPKLKKYIKKYKQVNGFRIKKIMDFGDYLDRKR